MQLFFTATLAITGVFASSACHAQDQLITEKPGSVFASRVEKLLAGTKQTSYQHTTKIDEENGTVHCDCSGLIGFVLRQEFPEAYLSLRGDESPWRLRPLAVTYYETFLEVGENSEQAEWHQVKTLMDAVAGDVIAWRKPTIERGSTTGHVLMVAGQPKVVADGLVRVRIIDSTRNSTRQGFGEGFKTFTVNKSGKPTGYIVGKKQRTALIAIGRINRSKEPTTDPQDAKFVGKDIEAVNQIAKTLQLKTRIVRQNQTPKTVPWKIDPKRLNFVVEAGKVIRVLRG